MPSQSQSRIDALNDPSRGRGHPVGGAKKKDSPKAKAVNSLEAAIKVLTRAKGPMHNRDLADAIPGGVNYGSFYAFLKAHPETFIKTRPAVFDLKERNPKGEDLPRRTATGKEVKEQPKADEKKTSTTKASTKPAKPKGTAKKPGTDGQPATTGAPAAPTEAEVAAEAEEAEAEEKGEDVAEVEEADEAEYAS